MGSNKKNHFQKKYEKESKYAAMFSCYQPIHSSRLYFLNELTSSDEINYLINIAQDTIFFAMDTEGDYKTNFPALIQILFIQSINEESPLLLVETKFLPDPLSLLFMQFTQLFNYIFRLDSHILCWGSLGDELAKFSQYDLFSFPIFSYQHNVQGQFKGWFNTWIAQDYVSLASNINNDNPDILIIDAPAYDPNLILSSSMINDKKLCNNEIWSLQDAVAYTCGQYLSKRETLRKWSIGLDIRLPNRDTSFSFNHRQRLIKYASLDCLSLANVYFIMDNSRIPLDPLFVIHSSISGKYSLFTDLSIAPDVPQINHCSLLSSLVQVNDQSVTVHDINERHQPIPEVLQPAHQHYQEAEVDITLPKLRPRHKRSLLAKQKRNRKSSSRHRRNRYNYKLIRSINMSIKSAKRLLRLNHIRYTNINIVSGMLHIGVNSEGKQQLYEQLVAHDMFV